MKSAFKTFYHQVSDYNLFLPDEHDYDDEPQDPRIALKHQKYTRDKIPNNDGNFSHFSANSIKSL